MSAWGGQARSRMPRIAEAAVERARLTVVPRGRSRARRVPFAILVSLLLLGGVVGLLLFNTTMQQASFRATALEQRASLLEAQEQQLRMQIDRLRDPQRVGLEAKRLGMVPMATPAFLRLSDGKVLGTPVAASPLDGIRLTPLPAPKPASINPAAVVAKVPHDPQPRSERTTGSDRKHRGDGAAARETAAGTGRNEQG